jgi:hypothetical protein
MNGSAYQCCVGPARAFCFTKGPLCDTRSQLKNCRSSGNESLNRFR